MTMQSANLLPALREIPADESRQRMSFRDIMTGLVSTDRAMFAAEFASAVSFGMWGIFDEININDRLLEAYETRWPNMSDGISMHDKVQSMIENGEFTERNWLTSGLDGQLAEFEAQDWLEENGYSNIQFPVRRDGEFNPSNDGWDIRAIDPNGQEVLIQVKGGASDSQYYETLEAIRETDYSFILSNELFERFQESHPELMHRIEADVGSSYDQVEGINDGLETLSDNMGIDIPDEVVDIVPFAGGIMASARLIHSVVKTEGEFKAIDRTEKNKVQVVRTLTLMSRIGVNTVLATVVGAGGVAVGSAIMPGIGTFIGGGLGMIGGAGAGMFLNRHLTQPLMLNLALNITGLTQDDLFYYKNKPRIDGAALTFRTRARGLAAAPGF